MFRKKNHSKKRTRAMLSAYSIIMVLIILLGILSHLLPKAQYMPITNDETSEVEVGPGEWEGESPTGGPGPLLTGGTLELPELPKGEPVAPTASEEETADNGARMLTEEPVSNDEMSNRSVEEIAENS